MESRPNLVYIYVVSVVTLQAVLPVLFESMGSRVQLKCDGTRRHTGGGGEVNGKLANGVGSQYPSHYLGTRCIQHYCR